MGPFLAWPTRRTTAASSNRGNLSSTDSAHRITLHDFLLRCGLAACDVSTFSWCQALVEACRANVRGLVRAFQSSRVSHDPRVFGRAMKKFGKLTPTGEMLHLETVQM
eukprot:96474-Amphidinium_carterae.2